MSEETVYHYLATRHDGSKESNIELRKLEETGMDFIGYVGFGGLCTFPKIEWKSLIAG
ncbi:MAG: hypothetical protein JWM32_3270 [Verrucomicrobia bacterium]|nr:hypothetical protein [Verrucomicrobiota bacterium]